MSRGGDTAASNLPPVGQSGDPARENSDLKVIFIIGKGRSGSTLLDNALGAIEKFFSVGELWVWKSNFPFAEQQCGCGPRVRNCPVWSRAIRLAEGRCPEESTPEATVAEAYRWKNDVAGWKSSRRVLRQESATSEDWPALRSLTRFARALYTSVSEVVGARVLVDSSKWPANPGPLGLIPGIDPYVIHLVRDPRAVTFSWQRKRRWSKDGPKMPRYGPVYSSLSWTARNLLAEKVCSRLRGSSMRVRYEDFVSRPRAILHAISQLVGESSAELPLEGDRTLKTRTNHTVMGNPIRFQPGEIELRNDREWITRLGSRDFGLVTVLTAPLLIRYGYPLSRRKL